MATIKYILGSITTIADTELNGLTNNTGVLGKEYVNSTGLYIRGLFQLSVTWGSAPTVDTEVRLYLAKSLDDTNYEDGSATIMQANNFVGSFIVRAVTTAQVMTLRGLQGEWTELPPTKFKPILYNASGQAFPSTGNLLKLLPYGLQSV